MITKPGSREARGSVHYVSTLMAYILGDYHPEEGKREGVKILALLRAKHLPFSLTPVPAVWRKRESQDDQAIVS